MDPNYLYLAVLGISLAVPLLRSFEPKIAFYKSFGPLFIGILLVGGVFIIWDILFTRLGFWGFNPRYLSGIYLLDLPLGEWLFFVVIPFCCVFIYRVMNYFFPKKPWSRKVTNNINNFFIGWCAAMAIIHFERWYTLLSFGLLFILILLHAKLWHTTWMDKFYRAYLIILIPFFMVNGLLTGFGIEEEIVWYNEAQMIGLRIGTVPLEDAFYGMALILGVVSVYEYLGRRWKLEYAQETTTE